MTENLVPRGVVGRTFATLSRLAVSVLFSWYAANFGSDNKTFGSLGAVIGWLGDLEALLYRNLVTYRA
jgi:uncharacterized BrkB/YihY/UPF0761 family membrane protein